MQLSELCGPLPADVTSGVKLLVLNVTLLSNVVVCCWRWASMGFSPGRDYGSGTIGSLAWRVATQQRRRLLRDLYEFRAEPASKIRAASSTRLPEHSPSVRPARSAKLRAMETLEGGLAAFDESALRTEIKAECEFGTKADPHGAQQRKVAHVRADATLIGRRSSTSSWRWRDRAKVPVIEVLC